VLVTKHLDDEAARLGIQVVWALGTSSVPVGHHLDGRADLASEVVSSRLTLVLPTPPPMSRFESLTSFTRATYLPVSQASSQPQMIGLTSWNRLIPWMRHRMTAWKTSGCLEFQWH
jgi:hypothetical protein